LDDESPSHDLLFSTHTKVGTVQDQNIIGRVALLPSLAKNSQNLNPKMSKQRLNTLKSDLSSIMQWKRISCKHNTRWQHLSRLKANAFFLFAKKTLVVKK
jgi:hypothetical protein